MGPPRQAGCGDAVLVERRPSSSELRLACPQRLEEHADAFFTSPQPRRRSRCALTRAEDCARHPCLSQGCVGHSPNPKERAAFPVVGAVVMWKTRLRVFQVLWSGEPHRARRGACPQDGISTALRDCLLALKTRRHALTFTVADVYLPYQDGEAIQTARARDPDVGRQAQGRGA